MRMKKRWLNLVSCRLHEQHSMLATLIFVNLHIEFHNAPRVLLAKQQLHQQEVIRYQVLPLMLYHLLTRMDEQHSK